MDILSMSSVYDIRVLFIIIIIKVLRCSQLLLAASKIFNSNFFVHLWGHTVYINILKRKSKLLTNKLLS